MRSEHVAALQSGVVAGLIFAETVIFDRPWMDADWMLISMLSLAVLWNSIAIWEVRNK